LGYKVIHFRPPFADQERRGLKLILEETKDSRLKIQGVFNIDTV